jgi:ribose 5-phosphate isomerase B
LKGIFFIGQLGVNNALCHGVLVFLNYLRAAAELPAVSKNTTMPFDKTRPIAIGSDHAGFAYKQELVQWLTEKGWQVLDKGVGENRSVDYPDYAHPVADSVESGTAVFGILLCGSGNGVNMTANKHQGIRSALCWNSDVVKLVRLHNDANVLCLPARFIALELAKQLVELFIDTPFEGGRHAKRIEKIAC